MIVSLFSLERIFIALIMWSLASAIIVVCAKCLDVSLHRSSASLRHSAWLSASVCIIVLPLIACLIPGYVPNERRVSIAHTRAILPNAESTRFELDFEEINRNSEVRTDTARSVTEPIEMRTTPTDTRVSNPIQRDPMAEWWGQNRFVLQRSCIGLWVVGMVIVFARYQLVRRALAEAIRRTIEVPSLSALTIRLASEEGIEVIEPNRLMHRSGLLNRMLQARKTVSVSITRTTIGPLVWGSKPAKLLLPASLAAMSSDIQTAAIRHELSHVIRGDEPVRRLLLVLRILFWFHPLVRYSCNQVQLYAELACDDIVLGKGHRASEYSSLLLGIGKGIASHPNSTIATSCMAQSQIARRIASILNDQTRRNPVSKTASIVTLVSMLLFAMAVVALRPDNSIAEANSFSENMGLRQVSEDETSARILSFPADRVVGTIEIRPTNANEESKSFHSSWKAHASAKGNVIIPAGYDVKLWVSADGATDMSFLKQMTPDAFYSLDLWRSRIEDEQVPFVARLTGLRMIRLEDTRVTGKGMQQLATLSNLLSFHSDACMANRDRAHIGEDPFSKTPNGAKAEAIFGVDDISASIFLSMPNIREIYLRDNPMTSAALPILGQLQRLERVSLVLSEVTDENLEHLARLPSLTSLSFGVYSEGANITDAGATKLALAKGLTYLNLSGAKITKQGLAAIAQLPNLETLNIEGLKIQPADLSVLKMSAKLRILEADWNNRNWQDYASALSEIRTLESVGQNLPVNPDGLRLFLTLPELQNLSVITGSRESFQGIGEDLGKCVKLKALSIQSIRLSDEDLLQCSRLENLESLALYRSGIQGPGLSALMNFTKLTSLNIDSDEEIDLNFLPKLERLNHIGLTVASMPSDPNWYSRVQSVESAQIRAFVGDRELEMILQWKNLTSLNLENSALSDASVQRIASLKQLEFLSIGGGLTSPGLARLRGLPRLRSLWVASPYFDQSHIETLERELGSTSVNVQGGDDCLYPGPKDGLIRRNGAERIALDAMEGQVAPSLSLLKTFNTDAETILLSEYHGKVVMINFWATWCGPRKLSLSRIKELRAKFQSSGFEVIGVHESKTGDKVSDYLLANDITWPIAIDLHDKTAMEYRISSPPAYYLIDRMGKMRVADFESVDLERAIETLLAE